MRYRRLDCDFEELTGEDALEANDRPAPEFEPAVEALTDEDQEELEELLLFNGATPVSMPKILPAVAEWAEGQIQKRLPAEVTKRTAEAIREICARLEGTSAGLALRSVISGQGEESGRALAAQAGVSHTAFEKQRALIGKRLFRQVTPISDRGLPPVP